MTLHRSVSSNCLHSSLAFDVTFRNVIHLRLSAVAVCVRAYVTVRASGNMKETFLHLLRDMAWEIELMVIVWPHRGRVHCAVAAR